MIQASLFQESNNQGGGIKIPVGIHTDIKFDGAVVENGFVDLNFTDPKDGRTIHKRVFTPSAARPKDGESAEQALEREVKTRATTLSSTLAAVGGQEAVNAVSGETFEEFRMKAAEVLNKYKGARVNLKVIPDWKEKKYPDVPDSRFIEKYVEGQEPKLQFTPNQEAAVKQMLEQRANQQDAVQNGSSLV